MHKDSETIEKAFDKDNFKTLEVMKGKKYKKLI